MNIFGPDSAGLGNSVTLTCSADSVPNCQFQWFFSSSSNSYTYLKSGAVVTFAATYTNVGNYTCQAQNSVTNITLYKNKVINLTGEWALLFLFFTFLLLEMHILSFLCFLFFMISVPLPVPGNASTHLPTHSGLMFMGVFALSILLLLNWDLRSEASTETKCLLAPSTDNSPYLKRMQLFNDS